MDQQMRRGLLMGQLSGYISILRRNGMAYDLPSDEEIKKLNDSDLSELAQQLKDLARTPH